ncbi:MAG: DsbA family protein [Archaeoglobaceae archaeon]|nr:DsbA family protein [Archaeoglobaceae archaeon]MDW8117602.1 DsbA family protein [Archaeoglobaceae archaeon]
MKKIQMVAILLIGIFFGIIAGFFIAKIQVSKEDEKEDFSKNLEKALKEINRLLKLEYPEVSARAKNYSYAGEFYIVEIEFYDRNGTLGIERYYISADGKRVISAQYSISLEKPVISEDDDPWIGTKDAKVVIVEFSDYACPYCAKFALEVEKKIVENYGSRVRLVFRDFPLPMHGETAIKAAEAANCAFEQGKFWEYHYILFERQKEWYGNISKLYDYAKELLLNTDQFRNCLESRKYRGEVEKDYRDGIEYGVRGTPTFFVNGEIFVGYISYENLTKIIEEKLK